MNHDITHCKGADCPLKKSCYRYLAYREAIERKMTYIYLFKDIPFDKEKKECTYFGKN